VKIAEEFNNFLQSYDTGTEEVDIRIEELTIIKSSAEIHGEIYINISKMEYEGWFVYSLIDGKFSIEDTLIESLVDETYARITWKDFIEFFETNLISFTL